MESNPVIVERTFHTDIKTLWKVITDKDHMKEWYFSLEDFKPVVGFQFQFEAGNKEKCYLHLCQITEVVPLQKIQYTWRYDGYGGNSLVTFELFEKGNQTLLKLTHEKLETFPASNPDLARENFVAGWEQIIDTSLKDYIEKLSKQ